MCVCVYAYVYIACLHAFIMCTLKKRIQGKPRDAISVCVCMLYVCFYVHCFRDSLAQVDVGVRVHIYIYIYIYIYIRIFVCVYIYYTYICMCVCACARI
jgi:hypothetical protein